MVLSMLLFAVEDLFVKSIATSLPLGEVMVIEGVLGALAFACFAVWNGEAALPAHLFTRGIARRSAFELTGRLFYALAIVLAPLSTASAILQATPLVVVAGAALVLREPVDRRRWAAILAGFVGVLIVLRPGAAGFDATSLLAVVGMLGFAGRDLATRMAPPSLSSAQLGVAGFIVLAAAGGIALGYRGGAGWPDGRLAVELLILPISGVLAYHLLTKAMRTGDVSAVTPFRYSRLLFGVAAGVLVFSEHPDSLMILGSAIIVASGVYTLSLSRRPQARVPQQAD